MYCLISALLAILAVVTSQSNAFGGERSLEFLDGLDGEPSPAESAGSTHAVAATSPPLEEGSWFRLAAAKKVDDSATKENNINRNYGEDIMINNKRRPAWLRWLAPRPEEKKRALEQQDTAAPSSPNDDTVLVQTLRFVRTLLDPTLLNPSPQTLTDIIDKVITSTPRLLAIANLLLSLTFLLHTAVADWFLGSGLRHIHESAAGRERLGGFLVFKLLLISAVVGPDTLDLLILLSWYTLLSFLRSLAHLCNGTIQHTIQSGQRPRSGVLKLLIAVLCSDTVAAAVCVALFHGAGWGMILLLTCDCALLGVDVICHILLHLGQVLENQHAERVTRLEAEQRRVRDTQHLEHQVESLEQQQNRRSYILETTVFVLQIFNHILTVGHFFHIWSLYGVQFTLIDGVLALHLHSAVSSVSKKIAERRNLYRIARDMDSMFEDATELELRKASVAGDVCCICLGTMSMGQVKKVGCGHLYHASCLQEVVERARSIEAARCPLCRASIMDGRYHRRGNSRSTSFNSNRNGNNNNIVNNNVNVPIRETERNIPGESTNPVGRPTSIEAGIPSRETARAPNITNNISNNTNTTNINMVNTGEHALFRFSTEGIFPRWIPLPAFSFEIVRRPNVTTDNMFNGANNNNGTQQTSFIRRLLVVAGLVPMSPEEEAAAIDQLVDMFPQYDRADLLRELRRRGSPEAVAESILGGVFVGVARGNNWQPVDLPR